MRRRRRRRRSGRAGCRAGDGGANKCQLNKSPKRSDASLQATKLKFCAFEGDGVSERHSPGVGSWSRHVKRSIWLDNRMLMSPCLASTPLMTFGTRIFESTVSLEHALTGPTSQRPSETWLRRGGRSAERQPLGSDQPLVWSALVTSGPPCQSLYFSWCVISSFASMIWSELAKVSTLAMSWGWSRF